MHNIIYSVFKYFITSIIYYIYIDNQLEGCKYIYKYEETHIYLCYR